MCLYPIDQPGAACNRLDSKKLSDDDKLELIHVHNDFRAKVASGGEQRGLGGGQPAGNIPSLVWDEGLAKVAQRWATQCNFNHDECRNTETFEAGQNIAIQSASDGYDSSMTKLVTMWYDEVKDFDPQNVQHYVFDTKTGHYSQLVWGTTRYFGCGIAKYFDGQWYSTYLVCNYGPSGNYQDEPVYKTV
ncbi:hypothetical protein HCN44_010241 [Aphidius gifuensis]|uniref:SCP domain-containing protein n=2 Tax=Aphidius gifuensis TaxID=684658 RepID=A0A834XZD1_APHGI|nr:hypothetical protein HCN44_010241 [Aphidius gifuensis]